MVLGLSSSLMTCGSLVSRPEIEPLSPALEGRVLPLRTPPGVPAGVHSFQSSGVDVDVEHECRMKRDSKVVRQAMDRDKLRDAR